MKRVHLISIIFTLSILLCDEGWIEVDGIEVSNHELTSIPVVEDPENTFNESLPYHSGWNWVGFPWLVDNEDGIVGNNPDPVVDIFNSVEEDIDWIWIENYVNYVSNSAEWIEDEWDLSGGLSEVESALGYKIELPEGQVQFEIPFVGTRVPAETPIDLVEGENWVPYFLPYPQHPSDAFPQEVLDLMSSIKAENWFMVRRDDVFYVKVDCPPQTQGSEGECFMLEYGAMYIIEMEDDMSFIWNSNGIDPPIAPTEPKPAENFTFIQKRDYIPVVIESIENIENGENIQEIGARNTNDYVGAEVVYGYPINLRIYDQSLSDITFEVILEDESYGRQNNDADLPAGKHLLNINSITVENNIAFVQLSDFDKTVTNNSKLFSSVSANPNPLNPNVKIKFKLNSDAIVDLIIYDVKGRKINTLVSGSLSSGNHSYEWRGNNEKSAAVSSGIYFYYLQSGSEVIQNKIMLLK